MDSRQYPDELIAHLTALTALSAADAERVIDEIFAYYREPVDAFVARRHLQLQAEGLQNAQIFRRIQGELSGLRFPAPALSERQIRRIIYG
jgi:hypothetical protein